MGIRRLATAIAAISLAGTALVAVPTAAHATGIVYGSTPLPGLRTNGIVRTVEVIGSTAYFGGAFTSVSGANGSFAKTNIAAIDLLTQNVVAGFTATANAAVYSMKASAAGLYFGGDFTTVNAVTRKRIALVNPTTGSLVNGFNPNVSSRVRAIAPLGSALWIGGGFDYVSGSPRAAVAALNPSTGAVLPPIVNANKTVRTIVAAADGASVFIGGDFTTLGGANRNYLAQVTPEGAITDRSFPQLSVPGDNVLLALAVDPNRNVLYGGVGGVAGVGFGNQLVAWDLSTGRSKWTQLTDGDVQSVAVRDDDVYFGFHEGYQGDPTRRLLAANADTGILDSRFRPTVNSFFGVWALNAGPLGLFAGGEFTQVSGLDVRRIAQFPISQAVAVTLVPTANSWRYFDQGTDLPANWVSPAFDDSTWATGLPQFGYGDGDETTVISYGPSSTRKYITSYYRTSFDIDSNPAALSDVFARLVADDGAVVYLNGFEVARDNLPTGAITKDTLALTSRDGAGESATRSFALNPASLVQGTNVITVELHQASASSSDVSFALSLDAVRN